MGSERMVASEIEPRHESAVQTNASAKALAEREVTEVQAAMVAAHRFPRDQVRALDRILDACRRPRMAELATYQYARGGTDITGPSIRLAEEMARNWGNFLTGVVELSRADGMSECLTFAWDLESNYRDEKRFQVRHWRDTKKGGYAVTDERDIYELIANVGARRKRACILAVLPGDVVEAAVEQCDETLSTKIKVTPELLKSLVEKFSAYGVTRESIEARIQRRLDSVTPAQVANLGKIFNSLQDGMSTAKDWFDVQKPEADPSIMREALAKVDAKQEKAEAKKAVAAQESAAEPESDGKPEKGFDDGGETNEAPVGSHRSRAKATVEDEAEDDAAKRPGALAPHHRALIAAAKKAGALRGEREVEIDSTVGEWLGIEARLYDATAFGPDFATRIVNALKRRVAQ